MRRFLAALLALVFALAAAGLLLAMITAGDLASCEDRAAFLASGEDECIEGSGADKAIGLILGYGASATAALAAAWGAIYASRRSRGRAFVASALATPVLALGAFYFLPVSF